MVYCGKPSKGCSACRERKVRCDQREPTCGQCSKRQIQCPGYRNMLDLIFRDESNHVIKKATNTRSRAAKSAPRSFATQPDCVSAATSLPVPETSRGPGTAPPRPDTSATRSSPLAAQSLSHAHARADLTPSPSSPRSIASTGAGYATDAQRGRQRQRHRRRRAQIVPSPLLGVLTPQSGHFSSATSEDSPSDDETDPYPQLVFSYYNPHLDTHTMQPYEPHVEDEEDNTTDDGNEAAYVHGSLPYSLSPSLRERGTAFFFSRYVVVESNCYQGFDFIYDVWKPPAHSGAHLASPEDRVTASMTAVGLAGLSKLTGCRETMNQARSSYGVALSLTNAALEDPTEASADTTMLAVLILGIYEFLAGRSPQTMRAWQDHVNGAAALASMRGTAQFNTKAGTHMFLMLCHSVLVNCIQSGLPMPLSMIELRSELARRTDSQRRSWRLSDPVYRALQTRFDIKCGFVTDVDEIVAKLSDIDDELAGLLSSLPDSWTYRHVQLSRDNPAALGRECHIYPGLQQVTLWNGLRSVRMLLQETILEQLSTYLATFPPGSLPQRHQHLLAKSMRMLELLGDAIIASVPQHFGVVSARSATPSGQTEGASPISDDAESPSTLPAKLTGRPAKPAPQTSSRPSAPKVSVTGSGPTLLDPVKSGSGGQDGAAETFMTLASTSNTILWPLYILGMSSSCSYEKKEYVKDRLDAIYRETKLDQARSIARMLESRPHSAMWDAIPRDQLPVLPEGALVAVF